MARVAMPLADDFEDSEFTIPYQRLTAAGHAVVIVGAEAGVRVAGKRGKAKATTEAAAAALTPDEFDGLVIPGGYSPDHLRLEPDVVSFVERFCRTARPVAAICHGPQLLIEADAVRGRTVTSYASVKKDLENAGAIWVDREVVVDGTLITSRTPEDLDAFCAALLEMLAKPALDTADAPQANAAQ